MDKGEERDTSETYSKHLTTQILHVEGVSALPFNDALKPCCTKFAASKFCRLPIQGQAYSPSMIRRCGFEQIWRIHRTDMPACTPICVYYQVLVLDYKGLVVTGAK